MSTNAVAMKVSVWKPCLRSKAWICWPWERSGACAQAGRIAEKVNWFGYMSVVLRMRLKQARAREGLLEWESWDMSVVHVTTLDEA